jgi:peptidoglycan/LPS O-acetylase OafA/YrhL
VGFSLARDNNLNLLRFLLASLVILSHAPELVDGDASRELLARAFGTLTFGAFAVDGFFLLSGYLILLSWLNNPSWGIYLRRRVFRIYPGFLVACLLCVAVVGPLGVSSVRDYATGFDLVRFVPSLAMLKLTGYPAVFEGQNFPDLNGSLWTIAYEFRCYLAVPVLCILGFARRRLLWLGVSAVMLALSTQPELVGKVDLGPLTALLGEPVEIVRLAAFFLCGGCFLLFRDKIRYTPVLVAAAAAGWFVAMFFPATANIGMAVGLGYVLFAIGFARIPAIAGFGRLPDVSYGVYLYAWPIKKLLLLYWPTMSPWLLFFLAWPASVLAGYLSYRIVERPFMGRELPRWIQGPLDALSRSSRRRAEAAAG